jgi:hypothetical protein
MAVKITSSHLMVSGLAIAPPRGGAYVLLLELELFYKIP